MSFGRILWLLVLAVVIVGIVYTGVWHLFTVFIWANPMLTWLPVLAFFVVGAIVGNAAALLRREPPAPPPKPPSEEVDPANESGAAAPAAATATPQASKFALGSGLLAFLAVLGIGLWGTLISKPALGLDELEYTVVDKLPQQTQPRLLPRSGIDDDPGFSESREVHLVRDPETGQLLWTGEWRGSWLGGPSDGIAVKSLNELVAPSDITLRRIQGLGRRRPAQHDEGHGLPQAPVLKGPVPGDRPRQLEGRDRRQPVHGLQGLSVPLPLREGRPRLPRRTARSRT